MTEPDQNSVHTSDEMWEMLSAVAWASRKNSFVIGKTKVGAAALSSSGQIYSGCNVEHRFRCHDVHAEVNAITNMVVNGETELIAILIVADRERFTPCGGCLDWIFQFGGQQCTVGFQASQELPIRKYSAHELMPHYPL